MDAGLHVGLFIYPVKASASKSGSCSVTHFKNCCAYCLSNALGEGILSEDVTGTKCPTKSPRCSII